MSTIFGAVVHGINGFVIDVSTKVESLLPSHHIVGLPVTSTRECRERVRSALQAHGYRVPRKRVVTELGDDTIPKRGCGLDLPIALSVIGASNDRNCAAIGELSLGGDLRSVRGVLPMVQEMKDFKLEHVIVPHQNAAEALLVGGITVHAVRTLADAVWVLGGGDEFVYSGPTRELQLGYADFADVRGHDRAIRAMEIAAAGGFGVWLDGPAGSGKSMVAKRLASILPPLSGHEAMKVTQISSSCGLPVSGLIRTPPFRAPHNTASASSMLGGCGGGPRPGEVTLAHHGVLLLDEAPSFPRAVIEQLGRALRDRVVIFERADYRVVVMPSSPQLVLTSTLTDYGDLAPRARKRLEPLMDFVSIKVDVEPLSSEKLLSEESGPSSSEIRDRVAVVRDRWVEKTGSPIAVKHLVDDMLGTYWHLKHRFEKKDWSAIEDRPDLLRVARLAIIIAELDGVETVKPDHIEEAVGLRKGI